MEPDHREKMRNVLRGMVLVMTGSADDQQARATKALDGLDDEKLAAVAWEALHNMKRAKANYDAVEGNLRTVKRELEQIRAEYKLEERAIDAAQKAINERDDIAAKYKELQKQIDPEKQQLEIMYAIDAATTALKEESLGLRRELGQRQTEVNDLRASKKRLREALDRLAGKD